MRFSSKGQYNERGERESARVREGGRDRESKRKGRRNIKYEQGRKTQRCMRVRERERERERERARASTLLQRKHYFMLLLG